MDNCVPNRKRRRFYSAELITFATQFPLLNLIVLYVVRGNAICLALTGNQLTKRA